MSIQVSIYWFVASCYMLSYSVFDMMQPSRHLLVACTIPLILLKNPAACKFAILTIKLPFQNLSSKIYNAEFLQGKVNSNNQGLL